MPHSVGAVTANNITFFVLLFCINFYMVVHRYYDPTVYNYIYILLLLSCINLYMTVHRYYDFTHSR